MVTRQCALYDLLEAVTVTKTSQVWLDGLAGLGVPAGPVNQVDEVFADPQVRHRDMKFTMAHGSAAAGQVDLIGNPIKFSETPVEYRSAPPRLGEQTEQILTGQLGLSVEEIATLRQKGVV